MKKSKLYITGAVLAVIGTAVLAGGAFAGGRPGFVIDSDGFHLGDHRKDFVQEKTELPKFSSAKLYLDYSDLEIVPSDTFALEYGFYGQSYEPETEVTDGVLTFREIPRENTFQIQFSILGDARSEKNYVRLYVPREASLKELLVISAAGDVSVKEIAADSLNLQVVYGDAKLKSVEMEQGYIEMEAGDLIGDRLLAKELSVESDYGDVKLSFADEPESYAMKLWTEYGEIDAPQGGRLTGEDGEERYTAEGTEGKSLSVSCEAGDIIVD